MTDTPEQAEARERHDRYIVLPEVIAELRREAQWLHDEARNPALLWYGSADALNAAADRKLDEAAKLEAELV